MHKQADNSFRDGFAHESREITSRIRYEFCDIGNESDGREKWNVRM